MERADRRGVILNFAKIKTLHGPKCMLGLCKINKDNNDYFRNSRI